MNQIKLFVTDFDGVMTDNTVYVDENGKESVRVHRGDGYAISLLKKEEKKQLILSTETNSVVTHRAKKLNIPVLAHKIKPEIKNRHEIRYIDPE